MGKKLPGITAEEFHPGQTFVPEHELITATGKQWQRYKRKYKKNSSGYIYAVCIVHTA